MINIKTDREVKENAKKLARELGLSLSDVMNAALRNFIRSREVYVSSIPQMTLELERLLGKAEKDIKRRKNLSPAFSSVREMADYLDKIC